METENIYYCELCGAVLKAHQRQYLDDIEVCEDCKLLGVDYD